MSCSGDAEARYVVVSCNALQGVPGRCRALQGVAGRCRALQGVAGRFKELQGVALHWFLLYTNSDKPRISPGLKSQSTVQICI